MLVGRSQAKTAAVAGELGAPYHLADYADLDQVRNLAAELRATYPRIDVLANNAGGIMGDRTVTKDGWETTFQVNHLAPFLLTHLLRPALIPAQAKVLQTSSVAAQRYGHIDIDDLQNEHNYAPQKPARGAPMRRSRWSGWPRAHPVAPGSRAGPARAG